MTGLETVVIEREGDGWLVSCSCGFARLCGRRPAADRVAFDHRRTHGKGER